MGYRLTFWLAWRGVRAESCLFTKVTCGAKTWQQVADAWRVQVMHIQRRSSAARWGAKDSLSSVSNEISVLFIIVEAQIYVCVCADPNLIIH